MAGIRSSTDTGGSNQSPEDYLDKTGVTTILKDMMTLLLENRPDDPIRFIADYLKHVPNTSIMKSYRTITLNRSQEKSFMDNLVSAYITLENRRPEGIRGYEFIRLIKMLCIDFPDEICNTVLSVYGKKESDIVSFEEFVSGIHSVILYEDFFAEAEQLFTRLASGSERTVSIELFFNSLNKLHGETDYRMPTVEEFSSAMIELNQAGREVITFDEFVKTLFQCTK